MKPVIDMKRCAAEPDVCPAMKECPKDAIYFSLNENEPSGVLVEFNYDLCDGCGKCVETCCRQCIEMK